MAAAGQGGFAVVAALLFYAPCKADVNVRDPKVIQLELIASCVLLFCLLAVLVRIA